MKKIIDDSTVSGGMLPNVHACARALDRVANKTHTVDGSTSLAPLGDFYVRRKDRGVIVNFFCFIKIILAGIFIVHLGGCATMTTEPVQQGMLLSEPPEADIYIFEETTEIKTFIGKTPTNFSIQRKGYPIFFIAQLKGYDDLRYEVPRYVRNFNRCFDFSDGAVLLPDECERLLVAKKRELEAEKRRKELLEAKLNAIQEKFRPYGFDVLGFVSYAKTTLRTNGEIDF